ncbi:MAG TPA: M1 family aminopeptidase [Acidobacteriaceae bacterium]|nr:M1 family aminopeptidase [Acidobacteriaceae bacterium]
MGAGVSVKDFTLKRQGGEFHFGEGTFFFYGPVNGWVTGAVFEGTGHFSLTPPDVNEQHSLALLTKSTTMSQDFTAVVLRFTDGTAEEIKKAASGPENGEASGAAKAAVELRKSFRETIHENLDERLLEDVLSGKPGESGFFLAAFHAGGFFAGKNLLFLVDPEGALGADGDQVELSTWDSDNGLQVWAAYGMQQVGDTAAALPMHVTDEDIDIAMDKSGKLTCAATVSFVVNRPGLRVAKFALFPTLRVSGVYSETGVPVDFVQEDKKHDPQFAVELPQGAKQGQRMRLLVRYSGPDVVRREGEGVYDLVHEARTSWYPAGHEVAGDFANYRLTFHVPKGLEVVATGDEVAHDRDGGEERFVWATRAPLPIVGFNVGDFKQEEVKTPQGFAVDGFADENLPDWIVNAANQGFGSLATAPGLKNQIAQGNVAIQIYSDYYGKLPWNHVSLTEQTSCLDGQGYPTMVYLPICAFWDTTEQHAFGLRDFNMPEFWRAVTPHEVAHQWWGDLVGWSSYRDQWMSEGFADFSAGLFLLKTSPKIDAYREFWNDEHRMLFEKNANGKRPIDVGPVTMGYRVDNARTGDGVARAVIYAKGAYILHMLEMMYWTPQYRDDPFKHSMQEFVKEYGGKAATTEDFKRSLEATMPKWLDLEGNGKLDWFFNEYVYGTAVPHYDVTSDLTANPDGTTTVHFKVTQSGVTNDFIMLVPLYLQLDNGLTFRLGNLRMHGDVSMEHTVKVNKMPSMPKKLLVNYNADVLSD